MVLCVRVSREPGSRSHPDDCPDAAQGIPFALNATEIVIEIGGGVALLLWGVRLVRTGITRAFGADLRQAVGRFARNRMQAFGIGLAVTVLLQSSTAAALMIASFASRGIISGIPAQAAMLGADVGTTAVVQLFALHVELLAPLFLMAGVLLFLATDRPKPKHIGRVAIGLGLMLLSLRLIGTASAPLRDSAGLATVMSALSDAPFVAMLLAAGLTWLTHSSAAMVLLVLSLSAAGVLPAVLVLALVLGANLGTGISTVVDTAGMGPIARRVPTADLGMRLVMAMVLLPFLPWLADWAQAYAPAGTGRLAVDFHTGFNLVMALVMLPLLKPIVALSRRLLPVADDINDELKPRHLEPDALDTPAEALAGATREALRMSDAVERMLQRTIQVFARDDDKMVKEIEDSDNVPDALHEAIKLYLTGLMRQDLDPDEAARHYEIMAFTTNLEHIGDIIDKNLMELASKKIKHKLKFSPDGFSEIRAFHAMVLENLRLSANVFLTGNARLARELLNRKIQLRDAERIAIEQHMERIGAGRADSIMSSSLHLDVIRDLKRINSHLTAVAYPILERTGELRASRLSDLDEETPEPEIAEAGHRQP